MLTDVFITESQKFFVLTILKVQEVMWIIIADYYLILPASSDHLTVRASIILWLKCPLLAAIVFHFAVHCTSLLCKKPYYLQIVKSSLLHFLQLRLHPHTEESADMNPLDLSTEKFGPCLRLMILHHSIFFKLCFYHGLDISSCLPEQFLPYISLVLQTSKHFLVCLYINTPIYLQ